MCSLPAGPFLLRALLSFIALIWVATASANPIPADCANHISSFDADIYRERTEFDRKRQKGWYYRWWTGKCDRVPFPDYWTCVRDDKKSWTVIAADLVGQARGADKREILQSICRLGEIIGLEWAMDNNVRCIHTNDLTALWAILNDATKPPLVRIKASHAAAQAKLGCRGK